MGTRWPRVAAWVAIGAVTVSVGAAAYLHLVAYPAVSPVADTVSAYVHSGGGTALALAAVTLACGFGALVAGLTSAGLRFDAATGGLAAAWGLGLVVIAWFPADLPDGARTASGLLHNVAGAAVFVCLPAIAWRLPVASRLPVLPAAAMRRLAAGSWLAFAGFVVTHPPLNQWYGIPPMHGLSERILLALQIAMLLVLAAALLRPGEDLPAGVGRRAGAVYREVVVAEAVPATTTPKTTVPR